jgi:hypothetical protein
MVIVGTCSLCKGPVATPGVWMGTVPAPRRCQRCGAHAKEDYGPVIEMDPVTRYEPTLTGDWWLTTTTDTSTG